MSGSFVVGACVIGGPSVTGGDVCGPVERSRQFL